MHAPSRSPRPLAAPLIVVASILMSLGSVGVVSAHDEAPTGAAALTIRIGTGLDPATARLAVGDIVEWVNTDDERHRMRSTSGPARFDSGNLERGEAFRIRVVAGTYVYSDHRDRDQTSYHGRLVVAATGSDGASNGGSAVDGGEVAPPTAAHVTIADRAFAPADIAVAVGGTVDWVNRDDRAHTVTAGDGSFGSASLDPGATFSETFATAGSFAYLCAIHPEMQGTIRVVAASGGRPHRPRPSLRTASRRLRLRIPRRRRARGAGSRGPHHRPGTGRCGRDDDERTRERPARGLGQRQRQRHVPGRRDRERRKLLGRCARALADRRGAGDERGRAVRPDRPGLDPLGLEAAVGVQAAEPERAGVGHQDHPEPDDQQQRGRTTGPGPLVARVEVDRVDQPRDERRGLLRVPAPVAGPGDRGPPRAEDDHRREDREADDDRAVGDLVEDLVRRQPREPVALALDEVRDARPRSSSRRSRTR